MIGSDIYVLPSTGRDGELAGLHRSRDDGDAHLAIGQGKSRLAAQLAGDSVAAG